MQKMKIKSSVKTIDVDNPYILFDNLVKINSVNNRHHRNADEDSMTSFPISDHKCFMLSTDLRILNATLSFFIPSFRKVFSKRFQWQ